MDAWQKMHADEVKTISIGVTRAYLCQYDSSHVPGGDTDAVDVDASLYAFVDELATTLAGLFPQARVTVETTSWKNPNGWLTVTGYDGVLDDWWEIVEDEMNGVWAGLEWVRFKGGTTDND